VGVLGVTMPLRKLELAPGVNKEGTRYSTEGGWNDSDKVRFRKGLPEKIGGWRRVSEATFNGVARSIHTWVNLSSDRYTAVGTNTKFYIEYASAYNDITPLRSTTSAGDVTFSAADGDATITVTDTAHGASVNDFVTFSGAVSLGGNITAAVLNAEYQITEIVNADSYKFEASATANSSDSGNGGGSVVGKYQVSVGSDVVTARTGWGSGTWGANTWGAGQSSTLFLRTWSQANFGEDLVFGPREGQLYVWDGQNAVTTRGVLVSSLGGASSVPTKQNIILVSDINRFVFCFGTHAYLDGTETLDPLLIRWSDQESLVEWAPSSTNQAGSLRLSNGSAIVAAEQARQEVLVWTDAALYALQYVGFPDVWTAQLVGENISIASQNAVAYANGIAFWMGKDKFYTYDGNAKPLPSSLHRYVFDDINLSQLGQVVAGTNEGFNEVWWFYPSTDQTVNDKYVVYNYLENIWYHGNLGRTAWEDSGIRQAPLAATYSNNLVEHEIGVDDRETATPASINAYITSSEFDLEDGHNFAFVWRVIPDLTFTGSTEGAPSLSMTLFPLDSSGSGYNTPTSEGGVNTGTITQGVTVSVEPYTTHINTRVRGRQMAIKIESTDLGVMWQLGYPRIDMRPDGRR